MDKSKLLEWYRMMVLIRRFEERCDELYQLEGKIKGFLHLYIGQEAVAVGTIMARQEGDHVITAYRDHAHALACGIEAKYVMAELMGKATGSSGGRGGSMHIADKDKLFWGGYGIVGGQIPLGVGFALAEKYRKTDNASLTYFGEGATNIGYFHEAVNMAKVWNLPVLFVAENNKYGMGTVIDKASAVNTITKKMKGYEIPSRQIDGQDILAVYEATSAELAEIRNGNGPRALEMMTYRYEGHSIGDRTKYRTKEELDQWRGENDPIANLQKHLLENYDDVSEDDLTAIQNDVQKEVDEAVEFANESPDPALDSLYDHIYPEGGA